MLPNVRSRRWAVCIARLSGPRPSGRRRHPIDIWLVGGAICAGEPPTLNGRNRERGAGDGYRSADDLNGPNIDLPPARSGRWRSWGNHVDREQINATTPATMRLRQFTRRLFKTWRERTRWRLYRTYVRMTARDRRVQPRLSTAAMPKRILRSYTANDGNDGSGRRISRTAWTPREQP